MYNCVFTPKALRNILLHAICWTIRIQINNYNFFFIFCKTLAHPSIICKIGYMLITWINVTIKKKLHLKRYFQQLSGVSTLQNLCFLHLENMPLPSHRVTFRIQSPNSVYMQFCTPGIILLHLISSRHDFFSLQYFFLCFCIC